MQTQTRLSATAVRRDPAHSGWSICPYLCLLLHPESHQPGSYRLHLFGEDIFGDVDQVAAQFTVIPLGKSLRQFFVGEVQATFSRE